MFIELRVVFVFISEKTYFFQDQFYWEFDDNSMAVNHIDPKKSSIKFMRCENAEAHSAEQMYSASLNNAAGQSGSRITQNVVVLLLLTSTLLWFGF